MANLPISRATPHISTTAANRFPTVSSMADNRAGLGFALLMRQGGGDSGKDSDVSVIPMTVKSSTEIDDETAAAPVQIDHRQARAPDPEKKGDVHADRFARGSSAHFQATESQDPVERTNITVNSQPHPAHQHQVQSPTPSKDPESIALDGERVVATALASDGHDQPRLLTGEMGEADMFTRSGSGNLSESRPAFPESSDIQAVSRCGVVEDSGSSESDRGAHGSAGVPSTDLHRQDGAPGLPSSAIDDGKPAVVGPPSINSRPDIGRSVVATTALVSPKDPLDRPADRIDKWSGAEVWPQTSGPPGQIPALVGAHGSRQVQNRAEPVIEQAQLTPPQPDTETSVHAGAASADEALPHSGSGPVYATTERPLEAVRLGFPPAPAAEIPDRTSSDSAMRHREIPNANLIQQLPTMADSLAMAPPEGDLMPGQPPGPEGRPPVSGPLGAPMMYPQGPAPKAVIQQIVHVSGSLERGPVEISLAPEELGKVRMTLTPTDQGMILSIVADRSDTLALLRRHLDLLSNDLRELGHENLTFQFGAENDGDNGQTGDRASVLVAEFADLGSEISDDPSAQKFAGAERRGAGDRLDMRL